MSIKGRIEDLEKKYGRGEGCQLLLVTCDGLARPPEGAADLYIKENNLCDKCTRNRLCVLYWDGETFSHKSSGGGGRPQRKKLNRERITPN